jgi:hypothetical protein
MSLGDPKEQAPAIVARHRRGEVIDKRPQSAGHLFDSFDSTSQANFEPTLVDWSKFQSYPVPSLQGRIPTTTSYTCTMSNSLQLRSQLQEHIALCKTHAARLAQDGGDIERILKEELGQWEPKDQERMEEERAKVIRLARLADLRMVLVEGFARIERDPETEALEEMVQAIEEAGQGPPDEAGSSCGTFEAEIRSILGTPLGVSSNNNNDSNEEDEDEELAIIGGGRHSSSGGLRCPFTCTLLEDPVKSTVCGHAYSKQAILNHLSICSKCPVAGCGNKRVRREDLKADVELSQLVRRQKRRDDAEQEQRRLSQVLDEDDFDDDDDVLMSKSFPGRRSSRVKGESRQS